MTEQYSYDLVILGGGAASFAAITEASRRDLSTALVNTGLPIGGTCVNVGCVPSKHLLAVGESAVAPQKNPFGAVQYNENQPQVDWETALDETNAIVEQFRRSNYLDVAEHYQTDVYEGYGKLLDDTTIEVVDGEDDGTRITGDKTLIATGSSPSPLDIDGLPEVDYYTSKTILNERDLPDSIIFIGGGYVALEWGQILNRVGVDVTILQRSHHVLSKMEGKLGREIQQALQTEGIQIQTDTTFRRVQSLQDSRGQNKKQTGVRVETTVKTSGGERDQTVTGDALFVATGVRPNSEGIGLKSVGVETNEDDSIHVDEHLQTTNSDVYAAGDVIGEPELETVAAKEGNYAVKNAFGDEGVAIDYDVVPTVVFTDPEIASVGMTEEEYMTEHGTCSCRTVRMEDIPRAKTVKNTDGLIQVVKHHKTDEIVGVHMVSPRAADMIMEATLAVKFGLTVDDIIDTIHPFPTFSEGLKRACQSFMRDTSTMSCCVE